MHWGYELALRLGECYSSVRRGWGSLSFLTDRGCDRVACLGQHSSRPDEQRASMHQVQRGPRPPVTCHETNGLG